MTTKAKELDAYRIAEGAYRTAKMNLVSMREFVRRAQSQFAYDVACRELRAAEAAVDATYLAAGVAADAAFGPLPQEGK